MKQIEQVTDFHVKHGFPCQSHFPEEQDPHLVFLGHDLAAIHQRVEAMSIERQKSGDERFYRCALLLEELSELCLNMGAGDETESFDAVVDMLYVLIGTAVTYSLPIEEGFEEVHKSNMSKSLRSESDLRMRDKGPDYVKPNMKGLLDARVRYNR